MAGQCSSRVRARSISRRLPPGRPPPASVVHVSNRSDESSWPLSLPFIGFSKMRVVTALVEFSMRGRLLTTGCVAAAALAVAHAQQQPPAFGTTTRTVAVYATVTDARGRLAPDLTRDNFEVDDNGVKQDLTVFSNDV